MNMGYVISCDPCRGELEPGATHKDYLYVRREGARDVRRRLTHYNLVGAHDKCQPFMVERQGLYVVQSWCCPCAANWHANANPPKNRKG